MLKSLIFEFDGTLFDSMFIWDSAVVEDAYHVVYTAKQDGFYVVGVHDSHESRKPERLQFVDAYLADYFDLTSFWKFASVE